MTSTALLPGHVIKQGDSLRTAIGMTGLDDLSGWKCRVVVSSAVGSSDAVLSATLVTTKNVDNNRFLHFLTRDTTKNWAPGDYFYMADVFNENTGEGKEIHALVRVEPQGVV